MIASSLLQLGVYLGVLLVLVKPLGWYMAQVFESQPAWLNTFGRPIENLIYRIARVKDSEEMRWTQYAAAVLLFNVLGFIAVYALQRLQGVLPLNPQGLGAVSPDSSFNTAISFATNTNWQGYGGESTMGYLTQMLGLAVQNFFSAATGIAVVIAMIRGFARHTTQSIGNFWVDLTRTTLYVLLPLSTLLAVLLVSQGMIQNFDAYQTVPLMESVSYEQPKVDESNNPILDADGKPVKETVTVKEQTLAMGPVASQIAIKQLGTNGGGYFNVNSAHPLENPTPLSNFLEMLAILLIPAALTYTFGKMVGDTRQGWAVLAAMTVIFVALLVPCVIMEQQGNSALTPLGVRPAGERSAGWWQHGRQGDALWHRQLRPVGNGHHCRLQRLGQLDARFLHPVGGPRADVAHTARRGGVRRRGLRALWDARVRHHCGVRRGTYDRAHTGISGQEDRGLRDENGFDRHPRATIPGTDGHRGRSPAGCRQGQHLQPRGARLQRGALRLLLGRQ
jgi:K+-transporting ATPase ATPase A chain